MTGANAPAHDTDYFDRRELAEISDIPETKVR